MPRYRIDAEQTTTTVFYVDAPNPMLALALILSANDPEPDMSQTVVHAIHADVTETTDETIVLQGLEGPVIVSAGYYDALKAQEKAETPFRAGTGWPYVEEPIEWETDGDVEGSGVDINADQGNYKRDQRRAANANTPTGIDDWETLFDVDDMK